MWSMVDYVPPTIHLRNTKSGEHAEFQVSADGTLEHSGKRFDQGDARRAAIAYLVSIKSGSPTAAWNLARSRK
jgi:hypothetical protein